MTQLATWKMRTEYDGVANALADRHYSRQTHGSGQIGPPGERLIFVADDRALWLTHYPRPEYAQDGLDAYRCSIFRNEGAGLSSLLIESAMDLTERLWGPAPGGWVTWIDTRKVASANPGYCFKQAGWWLDKTWSPKRGRRGRVRLLALPRTKGLRLAQLKLEAVSA